MRHIRSRRGWLTALALWALLVGAAVVPAAPCCWTSVTPAKAGMECCRKGGPGHVCRLDKSRKAHHAAKGQDAHRSADHRHTAGSTPDRGATAQDDAESACTMRSCDLGRHAIAHVPLSIGLPAVEGPSLVVPAASSALAVAGDSAPIWFANTESPPPRA